MSTEETVQEARQAWANHDGGTRDANRWFTERAAGWVPSLLRRIDDLEREVAALRKEKTPVDYPERTEPLEACQCHAVRHPPCSYCTSDDNAEDAGGTR